MGLMRPFQLGFGESLSNNYHTKILLKHKEILIYTYISGIKLFECEICKQRFSSNVALKEHMARHTDSKPHKCEDCGRMFRQVRS